MDDEHECACLLTAYHALVDALLGGKWPSHVLDRSKKDDDLTARTAHGAAPCEPLLRRPAGFALSPQRSLQPHQAPAQAHPHVPLYAVSPSARPSDGHQSHGVAELTWGVPGEQPAGARDPRCVAAGLPSRF